MDLSAICHNKTALVTGSSSGIGLGVGLALVKAGAFCIFNSPHPEEEALIREHVAEKMDFISADLSQQEGCEDLIKVAHNRGHHIDILVNNAGIQHVSELETFPPEQWQKIINLNLSSAFHTARLLVPDMKKKGWGRIVNIASVHGIRASPFKSAYVAAKHGLVGLTKTIALELARTSITCNSISPGYVHTPLVDKQIREQAKVHKISQERVIEEIILSAQPSRRFTKIEDIANAVLYLLSPSAQNMTGANLILDGGWSVR